MISHLEPRNLINLPPELIAALGEVSARYGQIEHLLTMTIHRTTGLSYDDAFAEAGRLRYRDKINNEAKRSFYNWAIHEFGEIEGKERAEAFNDLIQKWADLADERDEVIHCCWSVGIEDRQVTGTRKGEVLTKNGCPFGIKDVEKLGNNLRQFVFLLNRATKPSLLSAPEKEIAAMPDKFSHDYVIPSNLETTATAAAIFKMSDHFKKPVDD